MYRAMGAGPGKTITYLVDLPLPWGKDTEITLPMEALVNDASDQAQPAINMAVMRGAVVISAAVVMAVGLGAWWMRGRR